MQEQCSGQGAAEYGFRQARRDHSLGTKSAQLRRVLTRKGCTLLTTLQAHWVRVGGQEMMVESNGGSGGIWCIFQKKGHLHIFTSITSPGSRLTVLSMQALSTHRCFSTVCQFDRPRFLFHLPSRRPSNAACTRMTTLSNSLSINVRST